MLYAHIIMDIVLLIAEYVIKFLCGCLRNRLYNGDCSTCLKGFVKMIYLRLINERVQINEVKFYYYIIHFIFFVFFYT